MGIENLYRKKCKEIAKVYNFKTYKNAFYRVTNDVFQSFNFHKSVSGSECTVEFSVHPLCVEYDIKKDTAGPCQLGIFEQQTEWFKFQPNNKENMELCTDYIKSYILKFLIPFFEGAKNCQEAYRSICDLELNYYKKDVEYFLYDKFCMALKTGNYDVALAHIFNVKKRSAFAFEQNKKSYGDNISPDYIAKMEKKQLKYDSIILMLQRNETEKIQDFIYINETRNLNNLGYSLYD